MIRVAPFPMGVSLLSLVTGCNGPNESPTAPTPPPRVIVESTLRVEGARLLSGVGETAQLSALYTSSDGSTRNVAADASWRSSDPSIVSVSATGLLTVMQFGATIITAQYETRAALIPVSASPPGTFVISGEVREPGTGITGDVTVTDVLSGRTARTASSGRYSLTSLPMPGARLRFTKDGYEPVEVQAKEQTADAAIQRIIRLRPGDIVTPPRFAPNDLSYTDGAFQCRQCRLVRLVSEVAGRLNIRVRWNEPLVTFTLWASGSEWKGSTSVLEADIPVQAGETVAYLSKVAPSTGQAFHVPVTIEAGSQPVR